MRKGLSVIVSIAIIKGCFGQFCGAVAQGRHSSQQHAEPDLSRDTLHCGRYKIPGILVGAKSQFPIQQAIGLEFVSPFNISAYAGIGQYSRYYTVLALDLLPGKNENQLSRKQFIKDKMENGSVFEIGSAYHFRKIRGFYAGLTIQFQKFSMTSTTRELIEEYDFGDSENKREALLDLVDRNPRLREFYQDEPVTSVIRPIQIGLHVGKRFVFRRLPKLGVHLELAGNRNVGTSSSVQSVSALGNVIVQQFAAPIVEKKSKESFRSLTLPTVSLRATYAITTSNIRN